MNREKIYRAIGYLEEQPLFEGENGSYFYLVGYNYGDSETVYGLTVEKYDSTCGDGDGSYQEVIYKISDIETNEYCFIRFRGERSSWDDDHWNNQFKFVEPKQIMVTKWGDCDFNPVKASEN